MACVWVVMVGCILLGLPIYGLAAGVWELPDAILYGGVMAGVVTVIFLGTALVLSGALDPLVLGFGMFPAAVLGGALVGRMPC